MDSSVTGSPSGSPAIGLAPAVAAGEAVSMGMAQTIPSAADGLASCAVATAPERPMVNARATPTIRGRSDDVRSTSDVVIISLNSCSCNQPLLDGKGGFHAVHKIRQAIGIRKQIDNRVVARLDAGKQQRTGSAGRDRDLSHERRSLRKAWAR